MSKEQKNLDVVEPAAVFDPYNQEATGLSEQLQIDAVRRFDGHFKTLNEHMWWLTIGIKVSVFMAFSVFIFLIIFIFTDEA
jgi:hypothetical protein